MLEIDALFVLRSQEIVRISEISIHLRGCSFLVQFFLRTGGQSLSNPFKLISKILQLFYKKDLIALHLMSKAVKFCPIHHYNGLNSLYLESNS